ncbi:hypothetical protein AB4428_25130 [Vibrio lentus]
MHNLPTDNLYKFIALSGVFLFGFALYFITIKSDQLTTKIYITDSEDAVKLRVSNEILVREVSKLEVKVEEYKKNEEMYLYQIDEFSSLDLESIKQSELEQIKDVILKYKEHINKESEINKIRQELQAKNDESAYIAAKVELASEHSRLKIKELKNYQNYATFLLFFSSLMAYGGFQAWYLKLQRYQDQIVKNQATHQAASEEGSEVN